jgi:uncharacterized protein YjbI with pentapeptide repeats
VSNADLAGAELAGADLAGAAGLSQAQVRAAPLARAADCSTDRSADRPTAQLAFQLTAELP